MIAKDFQDTAPPGSSIRILGMVAAADNCDPWLEARFASTPPSTLPALKPKHAAAAERSKTPKVVRTNPDSDEQCCTQCSPSCVLLGMYVVWWVVGIGRRRGAPSSSSSSCSSRHQVRERGKAKNHQNGEEMPQTLMSTLVDCYLFHF